MSDILYSKLRLIVPSALDGEDATITSERGNVRTVEMSSPITDVMVAGMEKYRIQAGATDESVLLGYGQIKKVILRNMLKKLPYAFSYGSTVVLNGEIHILGGSRNYKNHYKWNGNDWVLVSTLPHDVTGNCAVVLNNEIHILCKEINSSSSFDQRFHYKWNGSSWVSVSTLPQNLSSGIALVLNNEIHMLGGSTNDKAHYKWNGSSWTTLSNLPYSYINNYPAVVYKDEIHIFGSYSTGYDTKHYKVNSSGTSYSVSTMPTAKAKGAAVVFNNEIHILGGSIRPTEHIKWDGNNWSSVSTIPYNSNNSSAIIYNDNLSDNIALLGTSETDYGTYAAQWDGTSWTIGED